MKEIFTISNILCVLIFSFCGIRLNAQTPTKSTTDTHKEIKIYFEKGETKIDPDFKDNKESLDKLNKALNEYRTADSTKHRKINISTYTSPDAGVVRNREYASKRFENIRKYLFNHEKADGYKIERNIHGIAWGMLIDLVGESDMKTPDKKGVLYILQNKPEEIWKYKSETDSTLVNSRLRELMLYKQGTPYRYMSKKLYPKMRVAIITISQEPYDVEKEIDYEELNKTKIQNKDSLNLEKAAINQETTPVLEKLNTTGTHEEISHEEIKIYYEKGGTKIDPDFKDNKVSLDKLTKALNEYRTADPTKHRKINISTYTSPDAGVVRNREYARKRLESTQTYLFEQENTEGYKIEGHKHGIAWDMLIDFVKESDMKSSDKKGVLNILQNIPEETWKYKSKTDSTLVNSRLRELMLYKQGTPYRYMSKKLYPKMRLASITISEKLYNNIEKVAIDIDTTSVPEIPKDTTSVPEKLKDSISTKEIEKTDTLSRKVPIVAIKTNLLYDALSVVNIGVEFPIGKRWSVAGEWIFPWWTQNNGQADSKRNRLQLLQANIEGKYWFGDRDTMKPLTGWYLGAYVGAGLYDFEYNAKGYQGEVNFTTGLSAGYAHSIFNLENLRLEYALSIGYLQSDYRYYEAFYKKNNPGAWYPIIIKQGRKHWVGPTSAKVSLVWLINYNKKGKGNT